MTIGEWWRRLRGTGPAAVPSVPPEIAHHEALGEQSYTAMYDARRPKDDYEDAHLHFHRAIEAATRLGRADEVARLRRRIEHITAVYNHQFRY
jgi:hypothetical protein